MLNALLGLVLFSVSSALHAALVCDTAADEFSGSSYSNQDGNGNLNWTSSWIERGDDHWITGNDISASGGVLTFKGDCCIGGNPDDSIEREINLAAGGYTSAQLRLSLNRSLLGASKMQIQASRDGGTSWSRLGEFSGGGRIGHHAYVYNITPYISANTRIRILNMYGGSGLDKMTVTSVEVRACKGSEQPGGSCSANFPDVFGVNNPVGKIQFLAGSEVLNSPDNILETPQIELIAYTNATGSTCGSVPCSASGNTASVNFSPGAFPSWGSGINFNPESGSHSGEGFIGERHQYYNEVVVPSLSTSVFSDKKYNKFYIKVLSLNTSAKVYMPPGDYYVESFKHASADSIAAGVHLIMPDRGTVRLFVKNKVIINVQSVINALESGGSGDPANFFMYSYSKVVPFSDVRMSGYIYADTEFRMAGNNINSSPVVNGGLVAGSIYLGISTKFIYNEAARKRANFGTVCPLAPSIGHYRIAHSGAGVTCQTVPVTISAHKSDNSSFTTGGQTINLSTSTNHGTWVLLSGSGTLNDATAGDGAATYTFAAGESSVQLGFKNTHAETLNINVSDGSASELASADPNLTMTTAGLTFLVNGAVGSVDTQIAGKATNVDVPKGTHARAVNLGLRVISADPNTGACKARVPAGNHNVQWAFKCNAPATCQMATPGTINGQAVVGKHNASALTYTTLSSSFDNNATTSFNLNYLDAGRVTLHAKMSVAATAKEPAMTLTANTNAFVVRPFGIGFSDIRADGSGTVNKGALPANSTTTGSNQFTTAGGTFDFSLGGYRYNPLFDAAAAADRNGLPSASSNISSGALTPNFTGSAAIAIADKLPAAGSAGSLGKPDNLTLTAGSVTRYNNQSWSEVGTVKLSASVNNYLGTGANIQGVSPYIGRFYPAGFVLGATKTVTPRAYMGQPFEMAYQLKAVNAAGGVTANYDDALGYATALVRYSAENNNNGNDIASRLSFEAGGWKSGVYGTKSGAVVTAPYQSSALVYNRPPVSALVPNGAAAPLNSLKLGVSMAGAINGIQGSANMNASTTGNCVTLGNCDAFALGDVNIRYGRLVALPAQPDKDLTKPVEIRFEMQYWDGSSFARDTNESTALFYQLSGGGVYSGTPVLQNYTGTLGNGDITLTKPPLTRFSSGITPVGDSFLFTKAPAANKKGSVNVRFPTSHIADWAEFDKDGDGATDDPDDDLIVPINFVPKLGHDSIILWKENP